MLNEEGAITTTLAAIRAGAPNAEVIVVDGDSTDSSVELARSRCDLVISSSRGRARQMNAGAATARGETLAFVHADTIVPPTFTHDIETALGDPNVAGGRFDLTLDDPSFPCRLLGILISARSRLMRSATGDQAIFVRKRVFADLGGFPEIELCEDIEFARRLRRYGRVACLHSSVVTSARRWRKDGLLRTIIRMWLVKSLFLAGVPAGWLRRLYADTR